MNFKKIFKPQFFLALISLIVASCLGNFFHLPLFLGVDFLFGSIPVLIAVYFYGTIWGTLTAFLGSIYTYFLWGHPYGILIFTGEALFVSLLLQKKRRSIAVLDSIYWLLIGMPLVGLFYGIFIGLPSSTVWLIALKKSINGIFNGLIANLIVNYLVSQKK